MKNERLSWFGHVEGRDDEDWFEKFANMGVDGVKLVERPRET